MKVSDHSNLKFLVEFSHFCEEVKIQASFDWSNFTVQHHVQSYLLCICFSEEVDVHPGISVLLALGGVQQWWRANKEKLLTDPLPDVCVPLDHAWLPI